MIRLFKPYMTSEIIEAAGHVMASDCLAQGPKVDQFEKDFAEFFNVKYPVSVNSGTSALDTAYDLAGLKKGSEVITTPLTCTATNIPLIKRGCKIIWADILQDSLTIDPHDVRQKISDKTAAVVQVHLGGIKADVGSVNIPVISDACQALGIFTGDYTCCSFQAIKHITTGDGGMVMCPDEASYKKAKLLRWFGIDRGRSIPNDWTSYRTRMMSFDIKVAGTKRHMNDIAAAMGIVGLRSYLEIILHRRKIFDIYKAALAGLDGIQIVDGISNVYWLFTVLVDRRDDFAKMLFNAGVETNVVQVRNDGYKIFGGKKADLPVMNKVEGMYISLPIGWHVTEADAGFICNAIKGGW